eukprot:15012718-Alexandrium_andersonii.AAC.1
MVHLHRPGEATPAGLAFATVEEKRSSGDLVEARELLGHQRAHGHVCRELALEIHKRHTPTALLAVRL